jgi:DNA polymerase-1
MMHEIRNKIDQHAATCTDIMELELTKPNRTKAKNCNFRMIYANPETSWYGYFMDNNMPDFTKDKWKEIVSGFFKKYHGLAKWHETIIEEVYRTGMYTGPTGRYWKFQKFQQNDMSWDYSVGQIRNYMVQGTAGDVIKVALVIANKRRKKAGLLLSKCVMCVHDSIIWDCPEEEAEELAKINIEVFNEIPEICERTFGFKMEIPIDGEADLGISWGEVAPLAI